MAASLIQDPMIWTTSTCTPEKTRGGHVFKIEGYSFCKGLGVGKLIRSDTFSVGGHDWCLCYGPDGATKASKDYISVYLELMDKDVEVLALHHLRLIEQATWSTLPKFTWPKPTDPVVFSWAGKSSCRGSSNFLNRRFLESSPYLYVRDDVLRISCEITVIKLKELQMPKTCMHYEILAMRSAVFKAELYGPMRDKCEQSITIEDMEPAVFKALLHFIYTDELPPMDDLNDDDKEDMVKHLLVAADRYAMERMKLVCESKLCKFLETKNVASTLALADQHHCSKLKDACIGFINSLDRVDDLMTSTGYQHLKRACPSIVVDMWEIAAKTRKIQ